MASFGDHNATPPPRWPRYLLMAGVLSTLLVARGMPATAGGIKTLLEKLPSGDRLRSRTEVSRISNTEPGSEESFAIEVTNRAWVRGMNPHLLAQVSLFRAPYLGRPWEMLSEAERVAIAHQTASDLEFALPDHLAGLGYHEQHYFNERIRRYRAAGHDIDAAYGAVDTIFFDAFPELRGVNIDDTPLQIVWLRIMESVFDQVEVEASEVTPLSFDLTL